VKTVPHRRYRDRARPILDGDLNDDGAIEGFAGQVGEAAKVGEDDVVAKSMRTAERLVAGDGQTCGAAATYGPEKDPGRGNPLQCQ
jgi:hypothetical protein